MFSEAIELVVVTPERQLLRESVVEVEIPGASGYFGVLPGHAPLMSELGIGELAYRSASAHHVGTLAIIQGFVEVEPDRVIVLAETAERAEEIDLARAQASKERAEKRLASGDANIDWDRVSISLQRALIRIQVGTKKRSALVPGA